MAAAGAKRIWAGADEAARSDRRLGNVVVELRQRPDVDRRIPAEATRCAIVAGRNLQAVRIDVARLVVVRRGDRAVLRHAGAGAPVGDDERQRQRDHGPEQQLHPVIVKPDDGKGNGGTCGEVASVWLLLVSFVRGGMGVTEQ